MFVGLYIRIRVYSGNSKSHLALTLFMNPLPLLHSSLSIFSSFIFISVVQSMFFWACKLASSSGSKLSFSNHLTLSTKFCTFIFFYRNSMSHCCLILFIKFLPFCLSSLFTCPNFDFYSFVHSLLFMI